MSNNGQFLRAVHFVLDREGVNSQDSVGGPTRFGIAQRFHLDLDIASLTLDDAIEIYKREYYDAARCSDMPWPWAICVFDCAVNAGVVASVKLAQRALGLPMDGVPGKQTIGFMSGAGSLDRLADFLAYRCAAYAAAPLYGQYGHGWLKRTFLAHQAALTPEATS